MSAVLALRLITYLLVCDGVVALCLAGLMGLAGALLVAVTILVAWWLEGARARGAVRPGLLWSMLGLGAVAILVDLFYLARSALDGMVHLLLFLILARLFMRRALKDLRDAGFLSFFLLVATSVVTFSVGFLFVFVAFLLLGTWLLMLHHVVAETERAGLSASHPAGDRLALRGPLARIGLTGSAATLAVAAILFFVIPRVGQATLPLRIQFSRMVTGFSDRVELGAFGEIELDKTVMMRVYVPSDGVDPSLLPDLRWRGIAFDFFDGRTWVVSQPERKRMLLSRTAGGQFQLGRRSGGGVILKQDIYLEPIGTDVVFAAPHVVRLDIPTPTMIVNDMGSLSVASASARLHYQAESELEAPRPPSAPPAPLGTDLPVIERDRYLQLPALSPRIGALARDVTAGIHDPYEAARTLSTFLSTRFQYTLAKPQTDRDPLEEFLFVRRSGNCEYFAAAMATMLRTLGVPARVVGGFQRGEWNPYGSYFMVHMSDAHAWVEAYFQGLGWVTFDPSPRVGAEAFQQPSPLSLYLDAARMRWYQYVVNWSLRDQQSMVARFHRQAHDAGSALDWRGQWRSLSSLSAVALLIAAVVVGWVLWRFRRARLAGRSVEGPPRFYERALCALGRRGLSPGVSETARQFCARTRAEAPGYAEPFGRITADYERTRFGAARLTADEMDDLERCLAALECH
jgi:transglutaminase-like putative cysteine protease